MYDFSGITVDGHAWGEFPCTYDAACQACEVTVDIDDESIRDQIIDEGLLHFDTRKKKHGLILGRDVPRHGLRRGDRIEPSAGLLMPSEFW